MEQKRLEEIAKLRAKVEKKKVEARHEKRERKNNKSFRHLKENLQKIPQRSHWENIAADHVKTMDRIVGRREKERQKEKRALQSKLKTQEQEVDYYERAKRLEEIPLLKKLYVQSCWDLAEKERIAAAIAERKLAVANQERFARMKADKDAFLEVLKKRNTRHT